MIYLRVSSSTAETTTQAQVRPHTRVGPWHACHTVLPGWLDECLTLDSVADYSHEVHRVGKSSAADASDEPLPVEIWQGAQRVAALRGR
eukprot:scaffold539_cov359-Prasinococcus_capsulatus_cf.AAC.37